MTSLGNGGLGKAFAGLVRQFQIMTYDSSNIPEPRDGYDLTRQSEREMAVQDLAKQAAEDIIRKRNDANHTDALLGAAAVSAKIPEWKRPLEAPPI